MFCIREHRDGKGKAMTDAGSERATLRDNIRIANREMLATLPAIPLIVLSLHMLKGTALAFAFWLVMTGSFVAVDVVNGRWSRHGGTSSFLWNGTLAGLLTLACWVGYTMAA